MANPVPSDKLVDLQFNARTTDDFVISDDPTTQARPTPEYPAGKVIRTIAGIQAEIDAALAELEPLLVGIKEQKTLVAGQIVVDFDNVIAESASIYIAGASVDSGRLVKDDDYTVTGTNQITMIDSYDEDTVCVGVSVEPLENRINYRSFDNVSDATNGDALKVGDTLNIKEYHTGYGGGGLWDVVYTASISGGVNTYNTIQCANFPLLALKLRTDGTLNVKQFGAKGDAVTDDTLPIETAMKFQQFAKILFPTGKYVVTSKLTVNDKYLHLQGEGVRVSEILYTGSDGLFELKFSGAETAFYMISDLLLNTSVASCGSAITIEATQASGVIGGVDTLHVRNVIADAVDAGYWTKGLHTINTGGVYVDSTSFRNNNNSDAQNDTTTRGIHIENNNASINVIRALSMSNFYIQRYYRGIIASSVSTIESIYVNNGEIVGAPVGLYFTGGGSINAVSFVSTHIDPVEFGLYSDTTLGLMRLDSCDFRAGDNGSPSGYSDYIGVRLYQGETVTITGCHFSGNNVLDPSKQSIGINLNETIRSVVDGNTFRNFDQGILRPNNEEYRIGLNDFAFVDEEVDQNAPQNPCGIIESKLGVFGGDLDYLATGALNGKSVTTINNSVTNKPAADCTGAVCETMVFDTNAAYQLVYQGTSNDIYYRRKTGGSWNAWVTK